MKGSHSYKTKLAVGYLSETEDEARRFANSQELESFHVDELDQIGQPYALVYRENSVSLESLGKGAPGPISASFLQGKHLHRLNFGGGKGQLIAKAIGIKTKFRPVVVDATAGLGQDSFVMASLGCQVTMLERVPFVYELLNSAMEELSHNLEFAQICDRIILEPGDSIDWLKHQPSESVGVVYLDPMYPHREKSALVKKEMKAFQDLIGIDEGSDGQLLEAAIESAMYRVVVKRPRKGQYLAERKPTLELPGKSVRYDVYTKAKLPNE